MILVTGGAGFIGANFVLDWLAVNAEPVLNLDALTYAGNQENLATLAGDARHTFVRGDICDRELLARLMAEHRPLVDQVELGMGAGHDVSKATGQQTPRDGAAHHATMARHEDLGSLVHKRGSSVPAVGVFEANNVVLA